MTTSSAHNQSHPRFRALTAASLACYSLLLSAVPAIAADQQSSIQADAQFLSQHSNVNFTVEGHCDERGSTEYNLALGDQRAVSVKTALTQAGVPVSRIKTISYGKEKPFCTESNEACWQQNRRGHFVYQK